MPDDWDLPPAEEEEDQPEFGPGDPDYDLSEEHGYTWSERRESFLLKPWFIVAVSLLLVIALLLPALVVIGR